ncbi:hypothetical protein Q0S22_03285 [Escherichia coli O93:H19]
MALTLLAANNAQSVLAAGINATATSLTVNTGTGNLFPTPVAGTSFFKLTLVDAATGTLTEIVHVTARVGDVMTIVRAQEGTTARIWSVNDIVANMLTAGTLQLYAQKDQSLLIANNLSEIAAAGPTAVAQALANLGLGAGAPPIGIPFFWPSSAMPNAVMTEWADMVFLKWNGATFSAATYPKLALVIPSLTLTEARGEFPRIWDDGRGVDSGRALLSAQGDAIRNINGAFTDARFNGSAAANGAFTMVNLGSSSADSSGTGSAKQITFNASDVVPTATENRPRNIAFNFLVRAK